MSNAIPSWRVEERAWRTAPSPPDIAPIGPPPLTSGGRFRCHGEEQTEWAAEVPERLVKQPAQQRIEEMLGLEEEWVVELAGGDQAREGEAVLGVVVGEREQIQRERRQAGRAGDPPGAPPERERALAVASRHQERGGCLHARTPPGAPSGVPPGARGVPSGSGPPGEGAGKRHKARVPHNQI